MKLSIYSYLAANHKTINNKYLKVLDYFVLKKDKSIN